MKIGILTQRLHNNFGGLLQNFALQQTLKKLGHQPITIDFRPRNNVLWFLLVQLKTLVLFFIPGKRRPFGKWKKRDMRDENISLFVSKYIDATHRIQKLLSIIVPMYKFNAIIVGSDQVWRPKYNTIENTFLAFVKSKNVKKIAYAASFGVSNWEFTKQQTEKCGMLAQKFDAISVRENSGVHLCNKYLKVTAEETLDPTLLLSKEDYSQLCSHIEPNKKPFLAAYVLDLTDAKKAAIEFFAKSKNIETLIFSAESSVTLTVQEWLSMYRDAEYIITDSFHGTVFSIINRKPFISIVNFERGADRFVSLLSKFDLEYRMMNEKEIMEFEEKPIDWHTVSSIIETKKRDSIEFLKNNLK